MRTENSIDEKFEDEARSVARVLFYELLTARLHDLLQAISSGDQARIRYLAHQLKGSASCVSLPSIAAVAGEIEEKCCATLDYDGIAMKALFVRLSGECGGRYGLETKNEHT